MQKGSLVTSQHKQAKLSSTTPYCSVRDSDNCFDKKQSCISKQPCVSDKNSGCNVHMCLASAAPSVLGVFATDNVTCGSSCRGGRVFPGNHVQRPTPYASALGLRTGRIPRRSFLTHISPPQTAFLLSLHSCSATTDWSWTSSSHSRYSSA